MTRGLALVICGLMILLLVAIALLTAVPTPPPVQHHQLPTL